LTRICARAPPGLAGKIVISDTKESFETDADRPNVKDHSVPGVGKGFIEPPMSEIKESQRIRLELFIR
jgi:hypothetical protein